MCSDRAPVRRLAALRAAVQQAWRMEPLEPRLLLSADPLVAGLMALAPGEGADAPVAYAAPLLRGGDLVPLSDPPIVLATDLVAAAGNIDLGDSVRIDGSVRIEATAGSVRLGNDNTDYVGGHTAGTADTLLVVAAADVRFFGLVGDGTAASDALTSLTIQAGDDVTFDRELIVDGDLVIEAGGVVTFNDRVTLRNGGSLTIEGATQIVFQAAVALQQGLAPEPGDVLLEANEINLVMGNELFSGGGLVTLRPTTLSLPIAVLSPAGALTLDVLNLETAELRAFADGFEGFVIGHQGLDGRAAAGSGPVTLGASTGLDSLSFFDPTAVYGGSITVADYSNPSAMLRLGDGDLLTLEAVGDIVLANEVEADAVNLVSTAGAILQQDATADDLSGEALRTLALTASAATGIDLPSLEVATVEASNTGSGDLNLGLNPARTTTRFDADTLTGSVQVLGLTQADAGSDGAIALTAAAGSITLAGTGVAIAGGGGLSLDAQGEGSGLTLQAPIVLVDGPVTLSAAGALVSTAAGSISASGASAITLTAGGALQLGAAVTTVGGTVAFVAGGDLDLGGVTLSAGPGGSLSLQAEGDLTVGILEAEVAITLRSVSGAILDGLAGDDANLRGEAAVTTLSAATGVGQAAAALRTAVGALQAQTDAGGGIFVREDSALTVTGLATAGMGDGAIAVQTLTGDLTLTGAATAQASGSGHVLLQALDGNLDVQAEVLALGGSISLLASQALALQGAVAFDVRAAASGQTLDLRSGGTLTMAGDVRLLSQGGAQRVAAGGALALGRIDAGAGEVAVSAGGALALAADGAEPDVVTSSLRLQAAGDIASSARALQTSAGALAAAAGGSAWLAATGDVAVVSLAGVVVREVQADASVVDSAAAVALAGLSSAGVAVLDAGGALDVTAAVAAGSHLRLASAGDMALAATVDSAGGQVSLLAGGDLQATAAAQVATGGGGLDIDAAGAVALDGDQHITTGDGALRLVAGGAATIGVLDAGAGTVALQAASLAAAAASGPDIVAATLRLDTTGGAAGAADRALALQVQQLAASSAGGLWAGNTGDLVVAVFAEADGQRVASDGTVQTLAAADAALAGLTTTGVAVLQATGALDVQAGAAMQAGAALRLEAGTTFTLAADLSAGAEASLQAGDALAIDAALTAASLDAAAGTALTQSATTVATAAQQRWQAGEALTLGRLVAADGDVALIAGGDVLAAAAGTDPDVQAAALWIEAGGAVGDPARALMLAVDVLAASAGSDVFLTEADTLQVGAVEITVSRVAADGSVAALPADGGSGLAATGALVLDSAAGALQIDAAVSAQGPLRLVSAGDLGVAAAVGSGGGALTLQAGGAMALGGDVDSAGGTVDLVAGGAVTMDADQRLDTGGGDLHLSAGGVLQLGRVDAGTGTASVTASSVAGQSLAADAVHLRAGALRLQATAGDLGSDAQALSLSVATLAAQAAGQTLALDNAGALVIGAVTPSDRQLVAADGSVQSTAGAAALSGLTGSGSVRVSAAGTLTVTEAVQAASTLRLAAEGADADLAVTAGLDSGAVGSLLAGRNLTVASDWMAAGGASAEAGGDVTLTASLSTADGDVWLAAGGALAVAAVDAGNGQLTLRAQALADADGGAGTAWQASAIAIDVAGSAGSAADGLELQAATLALRAGGDAVVQAAGDLAVGAVAAQGARVEADGSLTALSGDVVGGLQVGGRAVVVAADSLSIDAASAVGSGRLEAVAGGVDLAAALAVGGPLSVLAGTDLVLTSAGEISASGDASVDLVAAGQLTMADDVAITAGSGTVRLSAGGTLTLGSVATDGDVSLLARSVADAGTTDLDIRADALRVETTGSSTTQGFGSGARPLQLQVTTLAGTVAGTGAGGFFGVEADGLTVTAVGPLTVSRIGADGTASDVVDDALADLVSAGNLVLVATTGGLQVDDGDADGLGLQSGGNLRLEAVAGHLQTAADVRSGAGHVSLLAGGDIALGADLLLERSGRTVDVQAGGALTQAVGAGVSTVNSDVRLVAGGVMTLDRVAAGSGRISLAAADIVEAGDDTAPDLLASGLRMLSADGIGRADARLEIQVGTVSARAAGAGIWLQEADALRVGDVAATAQRVGLTGTVTALADAVQSDVVTVAGNGSIGLATLDGDIDLLDGTAPADGRSVVAHGSGQVLLDVQGVGAVLDVGGAGLVQQGPIALDSDLRVQGLFELTAGAGGAAGDGGITLGGALDGNPGGADDDVVLHADGAVTIAGPIGATTPLGSLRIDGATDVTLGGPVQIDGDLVIEASGVVRIDGDVALAAGSLTIVGATAVEIDGVTLTVGDLRIAADAIAVAGRLTGAADATLWLSAAGTGGVAFGAADGALQIDPGLLTRLDGFGALRLGDAGIASVQMAAGSVLDTGGRQITLQAAGDIGVSSIVAGAAGVVLSSSGGTIAEVSDDAAADVQAAWLMMRGRGPALAAGESTVAAALEVDSGRVDIDAGAGVVLRDSGVDGSVRYNLLQDGTVYQQLIADADVRREGSDSVDAMATASVAERLNALRSADADRATTGMDLLMRRPLAAAMEAGAPVLSMSATPEDGTGWLASRLMASAWLHGAAAPAPLDLPPARAELWVDPLGL